MAFFDEFEHLKIKEEEIRSATDNFADNKAIGVGGFGKVYKGEISHSMGRNMVAFKRLDSRHGQGNSEFWKEIMTLSRYTHENLISLLGYCDEGGEKILVYEHASRGSLDRHLGSTAITWIQRLKICLGAARGLSYLHDPMETKQQRVIHRDIKSANILLDENWNAKVSDLGLSKIGPANQQHTAVISNVVGTLGYLDPLYLDKGVLTKESDVYAFGVVLFEVLCGRLCFEYSNDQCQSLVRLWKQSYKEKKLHEIMFQDLIQQMNLSSLETFADIAYLCLQESREERPLMVHVVKKLEVALQFQEIFDLLEVPKQYIEIFKTAVTPMTFRSEEELKRLLSKGILVNSGKTNVITNPSLLENGGFSTENVLENFLRTLKWFSLNKNGEHCELISARECLLNPDRYRSEENSRFAKCCFRVHATSFIVHVKARLLSSGITYKVNLVFKYFEPLEHPSDPAPLGLKYRLGGNIESSISYLAYGRGNGWMMVELYQFTSDGTIFDLDIHFEGRRFSKPARLDLIVEGIEFRPLEKVEHEALKDEKVDMQPKSDVDWEQKFPNDYKQIIKWSKDSNKWTTKKEVYSLFRKGFLINSWKAFLFNSGEEWFSLAKNGKKCPMLPARATLNNSYWIWKSLPESKFREVAFNRSTEYFCIIYKIKPQILSPQTTYACYLVYKITKNHFNFVPPMEVVDKEYRLNNRHLAFCWYIYLLSPRTRVITPKDGQNTYNPSNISKFKGLPQLRNDGWMEVQVWEFQTGTTFETISMHLELMRIPCKRLDGLIVQGIEFKPL